MQVFTSQVFTSFHFTSFCKFSLHLPVFLLHFFDPPASLEIGICLPFGTTSSSTSSSSERAFSEEKYCQQIKTRIGYINNQYKCQNTPTLSFQYKATAQFRRPTKFRRKWKWQIFDMRTLFLFQSFPQIVSWTFNQRSQTSIFIFRSMSVYHCNHCNPGHILCHTDVCSLTIQKLSFSWVSIFWQKED